MPLLHLHQPTVPPAHDKPGGTAARAWSAIASAALALALTLAGAAQAQIGVQVSLPNGTAQLQGPTLSYGSSGGGRSAGSSSSGGGGSGLSSGNGGLRWDGREWKLSSKWESLSQSWKNLTGSQMGLGSTGGGSEPGCWVWVDEDWQPSPEMVTIGGGGSKPVVEASAVHQRSATA